MAFNAFTVAIDLVAALRAPVERIRRYDRDLADQIRRAASSVALNVSEGNQRVGRDRTHLFRVAAGSAAEVHAALTVACGRGYIGDEAVAPARGLLDRELAILWRLTHPRLV
jgi:four helix bundle protein